MIPYREGGASLVAQKVENSPTIWEDLGSIPGWGRSSGGHSNPLVILAWRIPMDKAAWWAAVYPRGHRAGHDE